MSYPGKLLLCLIPAIVNHNGEQMLARRLVPTEAGTKFGAMHSISVWLGGTDSFPILPKKAIETGMSGETMHAGWLPIRPVSSSILEG